MKTQPARVLAMILGLVSLAAYGQGTAPVGPTVPGGTPTPSAGVNGPQATPPGTQPGAPGTTNPAHPGGPVGGTYPNYSSGPQGGTNGPGIPNIPPTR